jgi:hypothetical protein
MTTEQIVSNTQKWLHEILERNGAKIVETFCCGDSDELITSFEYEGREYDIGLAAGQHWMQDPFYKVHDWLKKALEAKGARSMDCTYGSGKAEIDVELDDGSYAISIRPLKSSDH